MSGKKNGSLNRSTLAAIALAVSSVSSAYGQTAYYSFTGNFATIGDKHDFGINLTSGVTSAETFKFQTYANQGGTNAAGSVISAGGIDAFLELFSVFGPSMGSNDDGGAGFDSLLSWPGVPDSGNTLTSPVGSGPYTLNMIEFGNNAIGNWAVDLVGPAAKMSMNRITKTGTSTVSSFRLGTTGTGTNFADFNYDGFTALNIAGALTIAQTGKARFNHNSTTNQTTVTGITTINTGGQLNINSGTFNAQNDINVSGGSLAVSGGTLNLETNKAINLTLAGQFTHTPTSSYNIGGSRSLNVYSGSSATIYGGLDIASFIDFGTLNIDGTGSILTTNISSTSDSYWGRTNGVATITIFNSGVANIDSPTLHLSDDGFSSSSSTVNVYSGGQLNVKNLRVGGGTAGTASLGVGGSGTGSAVTQATGSTLVVGGTGASTGTLTVGTGGSFNTSTGGITINPTGTINLNGGGFNANSDVMINGGKLLHTSGTFNLATGKNLTASNTAQVSFAGNYTVVGGSTITVQSGSSMAVTSYLDVGGGNAGTLLVQGLNTTLDVNTVQTVTYPLIGFGGGTGTVTVTDQAVANYNLHLGVGSSETLTSSGTLNVTNQGKVNVRNLYVGDQLGTGVVNVSGSNSKITQSGASTLNLGAAGSGVKGTLNVTSSGEFNSGTGTIAIGATGVVNITGGGVFNANGNLTLNGGKISRSGSFSLFNLAAGKTLTASNNALFEVTARGSVIWNGSTYTFNTGADLNAVGAGAYVDVGDTTAGTLVVTGTGSSLSVTSESYWGNAGGAATVTISDNATATLTNGFYLCRSTTANTSGTLNILSGATLTSNNNAQIGIDGATGGSGFINVNGGTFSIVGATRLLQLGHATKGTAQLLVSGGGTFNTQGPITVNATGTLGNGNGTLTAVNVTNNGNFNSSSTTNVTSLSGTGTLTVNSGTFTSQKGIVQNTATLSFGGTIDIAANGAADGVSKLKNLSFGVNGYFNLHNNDLIVDYTGGSSPYTTVFNKVKSGLSLLGGMGNGIGSTEVDAQTIPGTVLAVVDNGAIGGEITSTSGFAVPAQSVIVKYTWFGDCNLDGVVNGDDYALTDTGFVSGGSLTGWIFGDMNFDGVVTGDDYALVDTGFIFQTGALPEPAFLGLLGIVGLVSQRRIRK